MALLVLAMLAYAIDVQAGMPRLWSGIGTVTLVTGSVFLFDGPSFSWITLLVGVVGTVMAMVGMHIAIRVPLKKSEASIVSLAPYTHGFVDGAVRIFEIHHAS